MKRLFAITLGIALLAVPGAAQAHAGGCDNREYRYERGLVFQSLRVQGQQLRQDLADQPADVQRQVLAKFRADKHTVMRIWIDANPCKGS